MQQVTVLNAARKRSHLGILDLGYRGGNLDVI
jgi:hypothetical protein